MIAGLIRDAHTAAARPTGDPTRSLLCMKWVFVEFKIFVTVPELTVTFQCVSTRAWDLSFCSKAVLLHDKAACHVLEYF